MLKKTLLILAAILAFLPALTARGADKGEKTFGLHTGYMSRNKSADAGLFFQYTFSERFRLQPSVDVVFRHRDRDAFMINLNAQTPFDLGTDNIDLYPYAGLNYSSWNYHYPKGFESFSDDVSTRTNRFGLNLGAGFGIKVTPTLRLSLEAGYTFVKRNSSTSVLAGIGYCF